MAAVLSNDAQIGLSGSEATIYIYNSGEKDYIKTFAQVTQKDGSFIVAREKINNFTLNDLKVKKICNDIGVSIMTFYTKYPNEKKYVLNRIEKELNKENKTVWQSI